MDAAEARDFVARNLARRRLRLPALQVRRRTSPSPLVAAWLSRRAAASWPGPRRRSCGEGVPSRPRRSPRMADVRPRPREHARRTTWCRGCSPTASKAAAKKRGVKVDGPREEADRGRADGRPPRRQPRRRRGAPLRHPGVPGREEGRHARRPRRQGGHVRLRRHLDQAGRQDGRHEVGHDGRGHGGAGPSSRPRTCGLPVNLVALAPLTENLPVGLGLQAGRHRHGSATARRPRSTTPTPRGASSSPTRSTTRRSGSPPSIVDYATLTGAARRRPRPRGGDRLHRPTTTSPRELISAGERTDERLWRLPLWDDYKENIRPTGPTSRTRAAGTAARSTARSS